MPHYLPSPLFRHPCEDITVLDENVASYYLQILLHTKLFIALIARKSALEKTQLLDVLIVLLIIGDQNIR